ncbi:MAG: bifunctional (p)ppGpp synthetase/guanosine-3',5'-bis(diphosphate) 3'-pyrophosphohydrolase [Selenomonadaceae bacterium]|nr:bifunctional (p)ppGpp synthetase/guanosine-3',5'-bis(diphosphate) 3'-pyrophosphohydrolase [Selenomonadaceae bacterium]
MNFANHANERIRRAYQTAVEAHRGQVDKAGVDYINHPLTVAAQVEDDVSAVIVALLHDTVEDTALTLDELRTKIPLTEAEAEALTLLTHDESVPYLEYVAAIKSNPLARRVKIADLRHNSDLTRIDNPSPKDFTRVEKYRAALTLLDA